MVDDSRANVASAQDSVNRLLTQEGIEDEARRHGYVDKDGADGGVSDAQESPDARTSSSDPTDAATQEARRGSGLDPVLDKLFGFDPNSVS